MKRGAIGLESVSKHYDGTTVVDNVTASIGAGEFVSLLGPSGSGKTTTLMIVAGFTQLDSGHILVDGTDCASVPPRKRGMGMVFQNYSLFPHLNVFENIAFPLRLRGYSRTDIASKVGLALELVQMPQFADRAIAQLSGGQQQRVALARAVVFEPHIVLMDEPLGALDKNLRFAMQTEIKEVQRKLGMTVLYVTHDQEEAMNMSDRMIIMNRGRVEQVGAPQELYDKPNNVFVAAFLGEANLLSGKILEIRDNLGTMQLKDDSIVYASLSPEVDPSRPCSLFVRPERMSLGLRPGTNRGEAKRNSIMGTVRRCSFLGSFRRYTVELAANQVLSVDQPNADSAQAFAADQPVEIGWPSSAGQIIVGGPS